VLDIVANHVEAFNLIAVVFQGEKGHRLNLYRLLLLVILAVAQPGTQVIFRADFDHVGTVQLGLLHQLALELEIDDVCGEHDAEDSLVLDTLAHLLVALDDSISLVELDELPDGLGCSSDRLLVDLLLKRGAIVVAIRWSTVQPVEGNGCLIETYSGCVAKFFWAFAGVGHLALRPGNNDSALLVNLHAFDPEGGRI